MDGRNRPETEEGKAVMLPMKIQSATPCAAPARMGVCSQLVSGQRMSGINISDGSCVMPTTAFDAGRVCQAVDPSRLLDRSASALSARTLASAHLSVMSSVCSPVPKAFVDGLEYGGKVYANVDPLVGMDRRIKSIGMAVGAGGVGFLTAVALARFLVDVEGRWILSFLGASMLSLLVGALAIHIGRRCMDSFKSEVGNKLGELETIARLMLASEEQHACTIEDFRKAFDRFGCVMDAKTRATYDLRGCFGPKTLQPYIKYARKSLRGAQFLPVIAEHGGLANSVELVSKIEVVWGSDDSLENLSETALWYLEHDNVSVMRWLVSRVKAGERGAKGVLEVARKRLGRARFLKLQLAVRNLSVIDGSAS